MYLYLCWGKAGISIWPVTDFWCIIEVCGASFLHGGKKNTLASITVLYRKLFPISVPISLTFISGDAHIDSCILMRKAFSWREFLSALPLEVKDFRAELILNYFLGLVLWSADIADAVLLRHLLCNAFYVVYLLSYSMCVNQNHSELKDAGKWILM